MSDKDTSSTDAEYGLIVAFPDESPSFVHGFEAGQIWKHLELEPTTKLTMTSHTANHEVIERMARTRGWEATFEPTDFAEYENLTLEKRQDKYKGLRVVK